MAALRNAVLALAVAGAAGQVIGIDFGSDFIKVAGVKPGTGQIDVVLNEQSKRKSNNYIGFRGDDRFLGEDAFNLAPRFPDQMYTFVNRLAGKSFSDKHFREETFVKGFGLPYNLVEDPVRKTISIKHPVPDVTFSTEELMAQLLSYVRTQAAKHMEIPEVTGAVITVPNFLTVREREAFYHAANLTGINLLGLLPNTIAAGLQYGVQRRGFGNNTANVVIYDMGASRTEVGVFRFTPPEMVKGKPKRGGEFGNMELVATAEDQSLGGRTFTDCIADYLAKKFQEKTGIDVFANDDKASRKAHTVLLRVANKAKEVLSANKQAPVAVEELYEGKPFFYTLKREEFEEIAADLFKRAAPVLTTALERAGLTPDELTAVEVIGGGVRVPRLQASLSEALGGRQLDKTLNGDECMALGAAFNAAKNSELFRTKGFTTREYPPYNVTFKLSKLEGSDKEPKMRPLFAKSSYGAKKSITVTRTEDFEVHLYSQIDGEEPQKIKSFGILDVAKALDDVGFNKEGKNASSKHSVQVQVQLTNSGLIELTDATVKYDEHVQVTKKVKVKVEKKDEEKKDDDKEEEKKEEEKKEEKKEEEKKEEEKKEEEKKDDEEKKDEKKEEETKDEMVTPEEPVYKKVNKTEIKRHRKTVKATVQFYEPHPMSPADYNHSLALLKQLHDIEELKRKAAAAKNDLETYMYWTKFEGVLDNEEMQEFVTEEEKEAILKVLEEVSEWAEFGDGAEEGTREAAYLEKKAEVEKVVSVVLEKKKAKEAEEEKAKEEARKKEEEEKKAKEEAEKKAKEEEAKEEEKADGGEGEGEKAAKEEL